MSDTTLYLRQYDTTASTASQLVFGRGTVHKFSVSSLFEKPYICKSVNGYPVYQKQGGGYTWSFYQRSNRVWHLDFDEPGEDWGGTLMYNMCLI